MGDDATSPTTKIASGKATLGGGCFWCLEAVFQLIDGVDQVVSGYAGGYDSSPSYEAVCSGTTGHAEVIHISFDPNTLSYYDLLEVFFKAHDPTTLNSQGHDVGTQYRSIIFFHDENQRTIAEEIISQLSSSGEFQQPIVTQVVAFDKFYPAESYHQNYFRQNPQNRYCSLVIAPKLDKFRRFRSK